MKRLSSLVALLAAMSCSGSSGPSAVALQAMGDFVNAEVTATYPDTARLWLSICPGLSGCSHTAALTINGTCVSVAGAATGCFDTGVPIYGASTISLAGCNAGCGQCGQSLSLDTTPDLLEDDYSSGLVFYCGTACASPPVCPPSVTQPRAPGASPDRAIAPVDLQCPGGGFLHCIGNRTLSPDGSTVTGNVTCNHPGNPLAPCLDAGGAPITGQTVITWSGVVNNPSVTVTGSLNGIPVQLFTYGASPLTGSVGGQNFVPTPPAAGAAAAALNGRYDGFAQGNCNGVFGNRAAWMNVVNGAIVTSDGGAGAIAADGSASGTAPSGAFTGKFRLLGSGTAIGTGSWSSQGCQGNWQVTRP